MNKNINLIIGSGVLGAYLASELLRKREEVIVSTRSIKKIMKNYHYLKIQKKVKFVKLDINKKIEIKKTIKEFTPNKIFYFAGQSSLSKSPRKKKETFLSHLNGTKNFLHVIKEENLKIKFFKANSGYIFSPQKGLIDLNCKFSSNNNPYIKAQQRTFKLIKKFRKFGLNLFNLVFMQIESPLRPKEFFIKKVCLGAKYKKKIAVGNIDTYRDYSWVTEIVKAIILTSELNAKDFIISAGKKVSGKEILSLSYKLNKLDYKKYFSVKEKFYRKSEDKFLIGSSKNSLYLKKNFNFEFKIFGNRLINKMYKFL
ncbi:GDP-mannose 4,6-dehydratase [Candidatus Pelagibacter bacterium nBUS_25]|uniref:GDP-mannose 4,6-dehydratase n=1 Tax=Candidatus Pelagibacter bacterium nBUS_25 TaxID=3374187 RepID=UPI003EBE334F